MSRLTRTPRTEDPVTLAGTIQDWCTLFVVILLIIVAVDVLP